MDNLRLFHSVCRCSVFTEYHYDADMFTDEDCGDDCHEDELCTTCEWANAVAKLRDDLAAHGFTYLGAGSFSIVFERDGYAYKFNPNNADKTFHYLAALRVVEDDRLPRIYQLRECAHGYVAECELLFEQDDYSTSDDLELCYGAYELRRVGDVIRKCGAKMNDVRQSNILLRTEGDTDTWVINDPSTMYNSEEY